MFKDNFQQSSNASAAYTNITTSRSLLPVTMEDGISLI